MNKIYHCTKMIFFDTVDVLKYIVEIFDEHGSEEMDIKDIYCCLSEKLQVKSVNMANLKLLLCYKSNLIQKQTVLELLENMGNDSVGDVCKNPTYSFVIESDDDLYYVISKTKTAPNEVVFGHLLSIFDCRGVNKITFDDLYFGLATMLHVSNANRNSLIRLLGTAKKHISIEQVQGRYDAFLSQKAKYEKFKLDKRIEDVKQYISAIHPDNFKIDIRFLAKPSLHRCLDEADVCEVMQLKKMSENDIMFVSEKCGVSFEEFVKELSNSYAVSVTNLFCDMVIKQLNKHGIPNDEWNRNVYMLYKRIRGATLAAAGEEYNLTRERVRQIENKFVAKFRNFSGEFPGSVVKMLRLYAQNPYYISPLEIRTIINQYADAFIYLLKICDSLDVKYIEEVGVFAFIGNYDWYEDIVACVSDMPDTIEVENFEKTILTIKDKIMGYGIDIPYNIIKSIAECGFKRHGSYYTRVKLTLQERYVKIMDKYYPNGFAMYDECEMKKFRDYYSKMFGSDLSTSNRGIQGSIQRVAILRDRGVYISINNAVKADSVLKDICEYIDDQSQTIFITNSIFYLFQEQLNYLGVDNKYYLQGLLHKYANDRYYFSRDYISKSKEETSLYATIVDYVKGVNGVVTKQDLQNEFPGVPQVVFSFALSSDEIIVGNACYMHKEYIAKNQSHVETLLYLIKDMTSDGQIHSSHELMDKLRNNFTVLIKELKINDCYFLFSIIEELFSDSFSMRRPFFAKNSITIDDRTERLSNYVREHEMVTIGDFMGYIYKNHFYALSILKIVDDISEEVFWKDKDTLIINTAIDVPSNIQSCIDEFLDDNSNGGTVIKKIADFSNLPKLNIEWNEWLLYSFVKVYSQKYEALTTDTTHAKAKPMFIKKQN